MSDKIHECDSRGCRVRKGVESVSLYFGDDPLPGETLTAVVQGFFCPDCRQTFLDVDKYLRMSGKPLKEGSSRAGWTIKAISGR